MILRRDIRRFVQTLVREFAPERVVLFGSCARGELTKDSDVDILVVMDCRQDPIDQAVAIRWRIPRPFPMDLIVRRPAEIKRRLRRGDSFIGTIMREGKVLYDRRKNRG